MRNTLQASSIVTRGFSDAGSGVAGWALRSPLQSSRARTPWRRRAPPPSRLCPSPSARTCRRVCLRDGCRSCSASSRDGALPSPLTVSLPDGRLRTRAGGGEKVSTPCVPRPKQSSTLSHARHARSTQVVDSIMAERVGFEPTCPFGQDAFEAPPLRPLRYLSVTYSARGPFGACLPGTRGRPARDRADRLRQFSILP